MYSLARDLASSNGHTAIHADPEYSLGNWASPEADVTADLLAAAAPWLDDEPIRTQLHRWRYSVPTALYAERCLVIQAPVPSVFAGDALAARAWRGRHFQDSPPATPSSVF